MKSFRLSVLTLPYLFLSPRIVQNMMRRNKSRPVAKKGGGGFFGPMKFISRCSTFNSPSGKNLSLFDEKRLLEEAANLVPVGKRLSGRSRQPDSRWKDGIVFYNRNSHSSILHLKKTQRDFKNGFTNSGLDSWMLVGSSMELTTALVSQGCPPYPICYSSSS